MEPLKALLWAKVLITFQISSQWDVDACFAFQESLENHFEDSEIGFVDGNDAGELAQVCACRHLPDAHCPGRW